MLRVLTLMLALGLGGCFGYDTLAEIANQPPSPGGTVTVEGADGTARTTAALGNGAADPMTVGGASPELTFALVAGDDPTGTSAHQSLSAAGARTELDLTATSRTRLEVHLDGSGCVATSGVLDLTTDAMLNLSGDFAADGTDSGGGGACHIHGTLANVPVTH